MPTNYTQVHQSPSGPGDARPIACQIIEDEHLEGQWDGKVILVTGCSSGLGVETARALYRTGATLYLTARDIDRARAALDDIAPSPRVHFLHLDLGSLKSVHACANAFKARSETLHVLIENAAVMACPEGQTTDGFETQFGTNHLGHFLLFHLLKPVFLSSSEPAFNSRVIIVSSVAHQYSAVNFDNINLVGEYDPWKAYGQSKTANIWTANEIDRRYGARGLHAWSLHPEAIAINLQRYIPEEQKRLWTQDDNSQKYWKSPEQGASTTIWAAISRKLDGAGGRYLEDCSIAVADANGESPGLAAWTYDPLGEAKLWDRTLELLRLNE
ncbi:uncharacterized protein LDX57_008575 [Aspergillus melleus]|uniref:uncharacterized protein n=1 Tax=Aspergillus melleus TaxID=138277 RepID=UPI001E8D5B7B|nr:uncharacterized protein LDX57_008575 [Aspergillus melleus]KAH8430911.1 hypothetical protein LDX57_008575 [Aspergillus melleus]